MKNCKKIIALIICSVICISCISTAFVPYAASAPSQIKAQIDSIISYKRKAEGAKSVQSLVSDVLPNQVGVGAEWYILSLVQYNHSLDFSKYRSALEKYVSSGAGNPTEKELYALLLAATGYSGNYISGVIESSTGKLGIISYVYSLHLMNLGYKAKTVTKQSVITEILSRQKTDGGFAVSGKYGDVDVTAMTLQALSQCVSDSKVKKSVDKALSFISSRLDENGEFSSYGAVNSESTSQVIIALSSLGIDLEKDSRFIKNGKTLIDTLLSYKMSDGSFSHSHEKGGDSYATVQALSAFVAYYRFLTGKGSIYKFSVKIPSEPVTTQHAATQKTTSATKCETTKAPSTTKAQSSGLLNGFDILGIFSQETENHTVTSQTAAQTKTAETVSSPSDTASSQTASTVSQTHSSEVSTHTESNSSQRETEETVTEPSTEPSSSAQEVNAATENQIAQTDEAGKAEKPSAFFYVISVLIIVGAVSAVIIIKKRH